MRFGITPLELANVVEIVGKGGSPDFSQFNFADILRETHNQGFSLMELTMDVSYVMPGGLTKDTIKAFQELKEELGLTFTAHLPLWAIEAACPNQYIRKASVECLVDAIELVKPVDPEVYVLHATGALAAEFSRMTLPESFTLMVTEYFRGNAQQSVGEILDRTGIPSRKLALENIEFAFEAIWQIAEQLDTSICFDTGHLLAGYSGDMLVLDFLDRYFDRIAEIHLHDGGHYPVGEGLIRRFDHQTLGTGDLPLVKFLSELLKRNYSGTIIFELTLREALESLDIIRKQLPKFPIE